MGDAASARVPGGHVIDASCEAPRMLRDWGYESDAKSAACKRDRGPAPVLHRLGGAAGRDRWESESTPVKFIGHRGAEHFGVDVWGVSFWLQQGFAHGVHERCSGDKGKHRGVGRVDLVVCPVIDNHLLEGDAAAADLLQDRFRCRGPHERFRVVVVGVEIFLDGGDEVGDRVEAAAAQGLVGESEPAFHQVEPRRGGRGEMEVEPLVAG